MRTDAVGLLLAVGGFLVFALVWPTVRLWRSQGVMGLTLHRRKDPLERVVALGMAVFLVGISAWAVLYAALGPEPLGIWRLPAWVATAGWALCGVGFLLTVVAQAQMGASWRIGIDEQPTGLVTRGLFSGMRNPIFTGMLLVLAGVVFVTPCAWTVMAWVDGLLLISLQARLEERHLLKLHGDAYRGYASRVGRFVPGVGRLSSGAA